MTEVLYFIIFSFLFFREIQGLAYVSKQRANKSHKDMAFQESHFSLNPTLTTSMAMFWIPRFHEPMIPQHFGYLDQSKISHLHVCKCLSLLG